MLKMIIKTGNDHVSFPLNNVTYFYGYNYPLKYEVIRVIRKHFNKVNQSEYDYDMQKTSNILIDSAELDLRIWNYFEIDTSFNLEEQFKLRSKSFMLEYLESTLTNIEYEDSMSTINLLFEELNEIITEKINLGNIGISFDAKVKELTLKNLLKLIELKVIKEELTANGYNLSYTEHILIQILIAKSIAEINKLKKYLVLIDLPYYDEAIIKELIKVPENIYFIVVTENNSVKAKREEVIYFGKEITPLYDDVELYNKIMLEYGVITTMEELEQTIKDFLNNKDNKITSLLKENL